MVNVEGKTRILRALVGPLSLVPSHMGQRAGKRCWEEEVTPEQSEELANQADDTGSAGRMERGWRVALQAKAQKCERAISTADDVCAGPPPSASGPR